MKREIKITKRIIKFSHLAFNYLCSGLMIFLFFSCHKGAEFTLSATENSYESGPVKIELPETYAPHQSLSLEKDGKKVPIQHLRDNEWLLILDEKIEKGNSITYHILEDTSHDPKVDVNADEEKIEVLVGDKPVITYHTAIQMPPEGKPAYYQRSGFIHPIFSPGGQVITDDFPEDHTHQHGMFYAWVRTTFEGEQIDFWNQQRETGTVRHIEVLETKSGPVFGEFKVTLEHLAIKSSGDTIRVLDEIWTVRVYGIEDYYLIDLHSEQKLASASPLVMEEYHYGGFGIRANAQWFDPEFNAEPENPVNYLGKGQGGFLTSEGKERIAGNHSRPNWVDMHGEIDGKAVGFTAMGHPDNFRFPQPVRLHPAMPYFCFAPSVLGQFSFEPGEVYTSAYRLFVHQGKADKERIEKEWRVYNQ